MHIFKKKKKNIYLIEIKINEIFNVISTSCDANFDCAVWDSHEPDALTFAMKIKDTRHLRECIINESAQTDGNVDVNLLSVTPGVRGHFRTVTTSGRLGRFSSITFFSFFFLAVITLMIVFMLLFVFFFVLIMFLLLIVRIKWIWGKKKLILLFISKDFRKSESSSCKSSISSGGRILSFRAFILMSCVTKKRKREKKKQHSTWQSEPNWGNREK